MDEKCVLGVWKPTWHTFTSLRTARAFISYICSILIEASGEVSDRPPTTSSLYHKIIIFVKLILIKIIVKSHHIGLKRRVTSYILYPFFIDGVIYFWNHLYYLNILLKYVITTSFIVSLFIIKYTLSLTFTYLYIFSNKTDSQRYIQKFTALSIEKKREY